MRMPNFFSSLLVTTKRNLGFTMIELLIVISILGILAVAVLSALNPVEQINRGRDTASRSDAEQLLGGIDRFYAFNGFYPWQVVPGIGTAPRAWAVFNASILDPSSCPITQKLSTATTGGCTGSDELKPAFISRVSAATGYNSLYIYTRGTQGDSVYVCFTPTSKAFLTEAVTRCGTNGAGLPADLAPMASTICPAGGTGSYICLP